jgi:ketosteroid isomerase-like protein
MSAEHKEIVHKIDAAFLEGNIEGFLSHCTDDMAWTIAGETSLSGKAAIREWMGSTELEPPKLTVDNVIAEGDFATAYGKMTMKGESGADENYSYCDIYRFSGDKVSELTSYVVRTDAKAEGASNV